MKERRNAIKKFIEEHSEVTIVELMKKFPNWSEMTIRRDLDFLAKERYIFRTKGGARIITGTYGVSEDVYSEREQRNYLLKQELASKAIKLLEAQRGVFIDSGSTMMLFAKNIPDYSLAIITPAPNIALEIIKSKQNPSVVLLGGTLSHRTISISGASVIQQLKNLNVDTAFMVASGFSKNSGFTVGDQHEADLKSEVINKARRRVMLLDSSKIGTVLPFTFANIKDVDILVTDFNMPQDIIDWFKQNNIEVI